MPRWSEVEYGGLAVHHEFPMLDLLRIIRVCTRKLSRNFFTTQPDQDAVRSSSRDQTRTSQRFKESN
jgi:hypothetical protein